MNKSYAQTKIQKRNLLLIINSIGCLAVDAVILASLIISDFSFSLLIVPIIIVALDLTLFFKSFLINFNFRYSIIEVLIHVVLFIAGCILFVTSFSSIPVTDTYMTTIAVIMFAVFHLLHLITYLVLSFVSPKSKSISSKIISVIMIIIFGCGIAGYTSYAISSGYLGQSQDDEIVINYYDYDERTDTYAITKYNGRGKTMIVPREFNGIPVRELAIKDDTTLTDIYIENDENIINIYLQPITDATFKTKIHVAKRLINEYRLTSISEYNNNGSKIINNFVPSDLDEDEVYINFEYDDASLQHLKDIEQATEIFPNWIGPVNTEFDASFFSDVDYIEYTDVNDEDVLLHCYKNFNKKILRPLMLANNDLLIGSKITENSIVEVRFEDIYQIDFSEDNDTFYENDSYKHINNDITKDKYRLAVKENLDELLLQYPPRYGFDLAFSSNDQLISGGIESYFDDTNSITVAPVWEMKKVKINSITADNDEFTYLYGDNITLRTLITDLAISGLQYRYIWENEEGEIVFSNHSTIDLPNVAPSLTGNYTLKVEAYADESDEITSLTSISDEYSFTINVDKRELDLECLNLETEYNASYQVANLHYDPDKVINNDEIFFDIVYLNQQTTESSLLGFKNAGTYEIKVRLHSDTAMLYKLPTDAVIFNITVKKHDLTVEWSTDKVFIYDGNLHAPSYTINNSLQEAITHSSTQYKNANIDNELYTSTITLDSLYEGNYNITNPTMQFSIHKRQITNVTYNIGQYIYNGSVQRPTIATLTGVIESEENLVILTITNTVRGIKGNNQIDADTYSVTLNLPDNSNYEFATATGNYSYTIEKKPVQIGYEAADLIYNGQAQTVRLTNVTGAVSGEQVMLTNSFIYEDNVATDAGSYVFFVSLPDSSNYSINDIETFNYQILPFTINSSTVSWNQLTFTYNGQAQSPFINKQGMLYENVQFDYNITKGTDTISPVNAGTYTIVATVNDKNFATNNVTTNYTISPKAIHDVSFVSTSFTYDASEKLPKISSVDGVLADESDLIISLITVEALSNNQVVEAIDAGLYQLRLTLASSNYYFENVESKTFNITQLIIDVTYTNYTTLTYNGEMQTVYVEDVLGAVEEEKEAVLASLVYYGNQQKDAGTYQFFVSLPRLSNYQFEGIKKFVFVIAPYTLDLVWSDDEYIYNALHQAPVVQNAGLILSDEEIKYAFKYSTTNVNETVSAGNCEVTASTDSLNVVFTNSSKTYVIKPKELTLRLDTTSFIYCGEKIIPSVISEGLLKTDDTDDLYIISIKNEESAECDAINVGKYSISIALKNQNYELSGLTTFDFEITPKEITAIIFDTDTFIYDGNHHQPIVTSLQGVIGGEQNAVIESLIIIISDDTSVITESIIVGTYSLEVMLPSDSNYILMDRINVFSYVIEGGADL